MTFSAFPRAAELAVCFNKLSDAHCGLGTPVSVCPAEPWMSERAVAFKGLPCQGGAFMKKMQPGHHMAASTVGGGGGGWDQVM